MDRTFPDHLLALASARTHEGKILLANHAIEIHAVSARNEAWSRVIGVYPVFESGSGHVVRLPDGDTGFATLPEAKDAIRDLLRESGDFHPADVGVDMIEPEEMLYVISDTEGEVQKALGVTSPPEDGLDAERRQLPPFTRAEFEEALALDIVACAPGSYSGPAVAPSL